MVTDPALQIQAARRLGDEGDYLRQLHLAREVANARPTEALVEMVVAFVMLARFEEAEAAYERLPSELTDDLADRADPYMAYGWLLAGNMDRAERLITRLAERPESMPASLARSRFAQARDQPVKALALAEQAVQLAQTPEMKSMAEYHRGYVWLDVGLADRAVTSFGRAIDISDTNAARRAAAHVGASAAHRERGDLSRAEQHAQRAIALHEAARRPYDEGQARIALAQIKLDQGQAEQALVELDLALRCLAAGESDVAQIQARLLRARILLDLERPDEAAAVLRSILAEPRVAVLGDEARVQLARTVDGADGAVRDLMIWLEASPSSADRQRVELEAEGSWIVACALQRSAERHLALGWFEYHANAVRRLGALDAARRCRATEVLGQLDALRFERARSAELASALTTQHQLRKAAEAAEAERRDLLELVAHDLRNPLSALGLLLDEFPELETLEEVRALLPSGLNAIRNMQFVLEEALNASEALSLEVSLQFVAVDELVRRSLTTFGGTALVKQQTLSATPIPPAKVRGTRGALQSVLDNLVSNALKFCRAGDTIEVSAAAVGDTLTLTVQDSGPGLVGDEPERIFDRRIRGRARPTAGEASTGLGLYLVRRIVQAHGGTVGAESEGAGRGTTFWVQLPLATP